MIGSNVFASDKRHPKRKLITSIIESGETITRFKAVPSRVDFEVNLD
jgi:hypothetical protein